MGLLNMFSKSVPALVRLPSGSFTVDRSGNVLVATLPSTFPAEMVEEIARAVLDTFRDAQVAQLPLAEFVVHYPSLKISAREMRGGAMIFLTPKTPITPVK
jgi:hypothetical protein